MLTQQEIFNKAYRGLKSQNFQQSRPRTLQYCVYRSPDGLKCAIGHLIPDELYTPAMEIFSNTETTISFNMILEVCGIPAEHASFATKLQQAHDYNQEVDGTINNDMESRLKSFARFYHLTVPE